MKLSSRSLGFVLGLALCGCSSADESEGRLDTRLETHAIVLGAPSAQGLAYLEHTVKAHRLADEASDAQARAELLEQALAEKPPPQGDGAAELAEIELRARAAESYLAAGSPERAGWLLAKFGPEYSMPIDRASARCLIALGDAAAASGDTDLAMASYFRAIEMLSLLMEEVDS